AALLYLPLSRRTRLARAFRQPRLFEPGRRSDARAQIYAPRLHRGEVRLRRPLLDLRSTPAEPRATRALRSVPEDFATSRWDEMRSSVGAARPVHRLRRASSSAADRGVRALMVRGADAARGAGRDGE